MVDMVFINNINSSFKYTPLVRNSSNNYNATVYLIGEDEHGKSKVITFDNGRANARNSARSIRGLYSKY